MTGALPVPEGTMTVGELVKALKGVPDYLPVLGFDPGDPSVGIPEYSAEVTHARVWGDDDPGCDPDDRACVVLILRP